MEPSDPLTYPPTHLPACLPASALVRGILSVMMELWEMFKFEVP